MRGSKAKQLRKFYKTITNRKVKVGRKWLGQVGPNTNRREG